MKKPARPSPVKSAPQPPAAAEGSSLPWVGLALAIVGVIVYLPALRGPFLFDDLALPFGQPNQGSLPWYAYLRGVRPLLYTLFHFEAIWWGQEPFNYHLLNLILHLLNTWMVKRICDQMLEWTEVAEPRRAWLALFGGALFLLHPLQTESVAYIASRSETLSVFFFLIAFRMFLKKFRQGISLLRTIVFFVWFGAALAVKEHVAVLPALLVLTGWWWTSDGLAGHLKRNWKLYTFFPLGAAGTVIAVKRALGDVATTGFSLKDLTPLDYFLTQCRALWVYFRMFLLPFGQNLDHAFPMSQGPDTWSLLGMIGLLALAIAAFRYRREYPLASYGYLAFLILMAPTSSFVPIKDALVERRLYLAFPALILIALEFLRRWRGSNMVLLGTLAAVVLAATGLTWQRNHLYASPITMWEQSLSANPANSRAHFQLAYAYFREGRCADANQHYAEAARLSKPDFQLLLDWALALDCDNQSPQALTKALEAVRLEKSAEGYAALGMIQAKAGHLDAALASLAEAEKFNPRFDMTYSYRGNILFLQEKYDDAKRAFEQALALNPNNPDGRKGLELLKNGPPRK